jgi:hypothetical protein
LNAAQFLGADAVSGRSGTVSTLGRFQNPPLDL